MMFSIFQGAGLATNSDQLGYEQLGVKPTRHLPPNTLGRRDNTLSRRWNAGSHFCGYNAGFEYPPERR